MEKIPSHKNMKQEQGDLTTYNLEWLFNKRRFLF